MSGRRFNVRELDDLTGEIFNAHVIAYDCVGFVNSLRFANPPPACCQKQPCNRQYNAGKKTVQIQTLKPTVAVKGIEILYIGYLQLRVQKAHH